MDANDRLLSLLGGIIGGAITTGTLVWYLARRARHA